jgi:hypothetical protein
LPRRVLGGRWREASVRRGDDGAIAERPHVVHALDGEHRVDLDAAVLVLRQVQCNGERVRGRGHRRHERLGLDDGAVAQDRRFPRRSLQTSIQQDLHAAPPQNALRERRELFFHLRQDAVLGVHQNDADLAGIDPAVVARHLAHEVVEFRADLDTGEPPACDDEREQPFPETAVLLLDGRFLERTNEVIAQVEGVGQVLEREGVLGQPPQAAKVGDGPERQDQVIVAEHVRMGMEPGARRDRPPCEVHGFHFADVQLRLRKKSPQRAHDVEQADRARDDFGQERLEDEVVFFADEDDLEVVALQGLECRRRVHPRESTAQHDHPRLAALGGRHRHGRRRAADDPLQGEDYQRGRQNNENANHGGTRLADPTPPGGRRYATRDGLRYAE